MTTRSQKYQDKLKKLSNGDDKYVSNKSLSKLMGGWTMETKTNRITAILIWLCSIGLIACSEVGRNINAENDIAHDNRELDIIDIEPICTMTNTGTAYSIGAIYGIQVTLNAPNDTDESQERFVHVKIKSTSGKTYIDKPLSVYVPPYNKVPAISFTKRTDQLTLEEGKTEVTLIFEAYANNWMSKRCTLSR